MNHLNPALLSAHLDGALSGPARDGVERHLAECEECRAAFAELAAQDLALKPALQHDPGDAYFDSFAARVEDRLRAAGLSGAQARTDGGRGFDLGIWFRSPRRLAALGVAAAVIAGAGVVLITARETPLREPELDRHIGQRAGQESSAPTLGVEPPPTATSPVDEVQEQRGAPGQARGQLADRAARRAAIAGGKNENLAGLSRPTPSADVPAERQDVGTPSPTASAPEALRPSAKSAPSGADERRNLSEAEARDALKAKAGAVSKEVASRLRAPAPGFAPPPATPPAAANVSGAREEDAALDRSATAETKQFESVTTGHVRGRVVDLAGRAVAGAQVAFPAQGRSVATDSDGRFTLDVSPGEHTISVMAVGYGTQQQQVLVGPESSDLLVALRPVMVLGDGMAFRKSAPSEPAPMVRDAHTDSLERAVAAAEAEQGKAAAARAPLLYDAAALQWQRALPLAIGTTRESHVRFKLAESRFRAWQVGKTQRRAAIAEETLTAFLVRARMGAARDTAARWLDQVKR